MEIEKLQKLGLNLSEAKVYLASLELGLAKAGEISKKAQINRTTIYDSIERLIERGLVTFVMIANKKVFSPISPKRFIEQIKEKEKLAEELLPELEKIYTSSKTPQEATIFKGRKGIKSILNDILKHKEYVNFGSSGKFMEIMQHDFFQFQKRKKDLKIKSKIILSEKVRKEEIVTKSYGQFKFIPYEFSSPINTFVYENKIAIIVWSEIPIATVITDKKVSESFRKYFTLLWKLARK